MTIPRVLSASLLVLALGACAPPTMETIQLEVFTPRCANAACHAGEAPPLGLNLEADQAYASIVDVPSVAVAGATRVVPGDPEASLLYRLTGEGEGAVRQMPIGFVLPDDERALLRAWIEDGAPAQ